MGNLEEEQKPAEEQSVESQEPTTPADLEVNVGEEVNQQDVVT